MSFENLNQLSQEKQKFLELMNNNNIKPNQISLTQLQIQNLIYLFYYYNEATSSIINGNKQNDFFDNIPFINFDNNSNIPNLNINNIINYEKKNEISYNNSINNININKVNINNNLYNYINNNQENISSKNFPISEGNQFIIIKHNSKKIFCCKYPNCNCIYRSKENLVLHFRNKHLMEKPYHCKYCGACFSHRNGKTYHERKKHTKIFPHKCLFQNCQMKFASKSALNYHLKHRHPENFIMNNSNNEH